MTERETLDLDIVIVGGGPAGLSAALRLAQLQQQHGGDQLSIGVLEKAREPARTRCPARVLDPSTLRDLIPDFEAKGAPLADAGASRRGLLPDRTGQAAISDHAAAAASITATTSSRSAGSRSG